MAGNINWSVVMELFGKGLKIIGNNWGESQLKLLVFLDWHKEGDEC